jgi:hypothetical protein
MVSNTKDKYILTSATSLRFDDDELVIINSETGFSGKGNKHAYAVLNLFNEPQDTDSTLAILLNEYDDSQKERIKKSTKKIIEWAIERQILKKVRQATK